MTTFRGAWRMSYRLSLILALGVLASSSTRADEAQSAKLVEAATTGAGTARYTAIDDLGERAADAKLVVPKLTENLSNDDPQVVWRSAHALGDYGDAAASATTQLRDLLASDNPIIVYHAAIALGKVGDKSDETIDALVKAVGSKDMRVSRAAIVAIKTLQPGPKKTVPALKKALAAGDQAVAIHALDAVVEQGANAVPFINEALKDPATAYFAAAAAEQIGPDAAASVPNLVELLGDTRHSQLDTRVLLALGRIGPAAKSAVPAILEEMKTATDQTVPVAAAFALGMIGDPQGDAALKAAAAKTDRPFLSMVAAWSLARIHPQDAEMKKQAMDKLNAGMKSSDPDLKAAAEKGMKMMETPATPSTGSKS